MQPVDILILSNGPGEVTTWVRPVVKSLRQQLGDDRSLVRLSVVLSPCPNATGKEADIVRSYSEVDRVQSADNFVPFLLWGKTAEQWDWYSQGVVLFLGGDQFFTVVIAKRLGYRSVVYAEWDCRWYSLINRFGVMKPEMILKAPKKYAHKLTVVGDLMADIEVNQVNGLSTQVNDSSITSATYSFAASSQPKPLNSTRERIGLLPGSKAAKLAQGVPLTLAIAEYIHAFRPQTEFVIPVAPTLDLSTLARFANPQQNPLIKTFGGGEAQLIESDPTPFKDTLIPRNLRQTNTQHSTPNYFLQTPSGLCIELYQEFPAHDLLSQCQICLTTVGANTAELGALTIPMIVLLPTQQLEAMKAWDGLPGILARLPGVGSSFAKLINTLILQQKRLFAWPNIWANQEIVPELVGKLQPQAVAKLTIDYLEHPEKLEDMRSRLRSVRGEPGAAQKLTQLVQEEWITML